MPDLYARRLELTSLRDGDPAEGFSAALRDWVGNRWPSGKPWFSLTEPASIRSEEGSIYRWEPFMEGNRVLIDFTWRHADAFDTAVSWVTAVTYIGLPERISLTLKVSNTALPDAPKLTTRPRLLLELIRHFRVRGVEGELTEECQVIRHVDVPFLVRYELFDPRRRYPILVVTRRDDGSFVLDPRQLGREFVSLAKPFALEDAQASFGLTDELRRRELSVYLGAARLYMPGFNRNADPYQHPLILPHRLSVGGARMGIAQFLAAGTLRSFDPDPAIPLLRDERAVVVDQRRRSTLENLTRTSTVDVQQWQAIAEEYAGDNDDLKEMIRDLENQVRTLENKASALQFALTQRIVEPRPEPADQLALEPETVLEAVEVAQEMYKDKITILPHALETAAESPYRRTAELARVLGVLADVSERLRTGPLGRPLKEEFGNKGVDYRQGISKTSSKKTKEQFQFTYNGEELACEEHITLGGGTYAPEDCLRIYFCCQAGRGIVVGHVGRHLDTDRTT